MKKVPATVITGFLGAGKTTLIRHLIEHAGGRRLALIINEFGDVGVDGALVRGCGDEACPDEDIIELANGCICCTVADDFLPTMQKLLDRPTPPDHIIIETSGLALPKPLVKAFQWPDIRTRATVDGVIALIDADALAAGRFAHDEAALAAARAADPTLDHDSPIEELFEDQLACADLVLLNKTDLVAVDRLAVLERELAQEIRPGVRILRTARGEIDPAILLGLGAGVEDGIDARPSHHDDGEDHDHDDFESFIVDLGELSGPEPLLAALAESIAVHDILRVKGFLAIEGRPARLVLQAVGPRIQHHYDRHWQADEPRRSRLVVIGQSGMDRAAIEAALGAQMAAA
ncbi:MULTISPECIES: cobalamin biosynthesis protein CobW [Sphingobium]|jgi:cobalamin biosynthesis protein CobW|uniref:Cobalamin biosynthesis protein CobW n=1 Tax=Sphingobium fuliginis (strain ATCC 27551) TaxID=336203 RepID=A0A4Q4IX67_SPHSA|nr:MULTISPECIES: cobalamin biosynthesis protein CobW [Sphingobium]QOT74079.1 cobalamin biosynthesis protein CobW [Sphingobium fuliginis]RYL98233.1 cobalamin biosynthesis protein CobW [Sphingobium fuliginis]WDA35352.1 cobalamin biosynthesis protein CobW [Sphingobium sp. YC-XJ3]GFZ90860.1 cobalamin biosynthesis protein CobW [Sphingobium fuliginis]